MKKFNIAIVGVGPRGLHAFENLILQSAKNQTLDKIEVTLFEKTPYYGCGPIYSPVQQDGN